MKLGVGDVCRILGAGRRAAIQLSEAARSERRGLVFEVLDQIDRRG